MKKKNHLMPEQIQPGKTYMMDSGRLRTVEKIAFDRVGREMVCYRPILKGEKLGSPTFCLMSTFAVKALREVSDKN